MVIKYALFLSVSLLIVVLLCFYFINKIARHFPNWDYQTLVNWLIIITFIFMFSGLFANYLPNKSEQMRSFASLHLSISYFLMAIVSHVFVVFFTHDLLTFVVKIASKINSPGLGSSLVFLRSPYSLLIDAGLVIAFTIFTYSMAYSPKLQEIEIKSKNIPKEFDNFSFIFISDLHLGANIDMDFYNKVAAIINSTNFDAFFIVGDLADLQAKYSTEYLTKLGQINPPYGKYYITGNHEYYWNAPEWTAAMEKVGYKVLLNTQETIKRGENSLFLSGVPDLQGESFPEKHTINLAMLTSKFTNSQQYRILFAHNPQTAERYDISKFNLIVSGHTHAGQFFPWTLLVHAVHKYAHGLYNINENTSILVNSGVGFWGPPARTVKGEITKVILKSE